MPKFLIILSLALSGFTFASSAGAQCRTTDRSIRKSLTLVRGSASVRDTVRLCTSHVFHFRAAKGQHLNIKLRTGPKTSMTVLPPSGEALIDGELAWNGRLTETGEYEIPIGTDATARYTLEISSR